MANTMDLSTFLKELQESGTDGTSRYNLRNENEQVKERVGSIPKLKKEKKKKSKLLIPVELAIPFNPTTGKADDTYNPDKKFRPQLAPTTVGLMLKSYADSNEDVKQTFMDKAGVDNWDTSDHEHLTADDKAIFKKYRVPSIYTFPVVHVDIPAMTGDYGRDYLVKIDRDPITGNVVGDKKLITQAYEFFRDIAYEEYRDFNDKCMKGVLTLTDKQKKEETSKIFGRTPVSDDRPANYVLALEIPLNNKEEIESTDLRLYESMELDSLKKMLVQFRLTNKMRESIDKYLRGDWERFDNYFDFFEIDMSCPAEGETPMEIGQGTSYEKPSVSLATYPCKDTFTALWSQYIEEMQDLERIMIASTRIPKYDEHVDAQLCASLYTVVNVDNQYITKDVIKRHKEFITIALGDTGSELLLDLEMDSESREQGQLSSGNSAKEVKELSVDDIMNEDSDEIDLDSLDEIQ